MIDKNINFSRVIILYIFYAVLALILIGQLFKLQIQNGEQYAKMAKRNAEKTFIQKKPIGKILDRHGTIIVDTQPCYNLVLKAGFRRKLKRSLEFLTNNDINFDEAFLKKQQGLYPLWYPLTLLYDIDQQTLTQLSFYLHAYPELSIETSYKRVYKEKESWGSVTGYLKQDPIRKNYTASSGVEKYFENSLEGQASTFEIIKTARNEIKNISQISHGTRGTDLYLTIDNHLQNFGYSLFEKHSSNGALIAIDPHSGEILALISAPGFDAASIQQNISKLNQNEDKPLFNRALQGLYPPASLLKPVIALAALEENIITEQSKIYDPGYYSLPGLSRKYKDWKSIGHGEVNVNKALRESCDTFFYDLGFKLGIDKMSKWLEIFGFGQSFKTLGLPNESGLRPSRQWKLDVKNEPWYKGESIITAIGQGYLNATPLQLAYMCSFFANKGYSYSPTLTRENTENRQAQQIELEQNQIWEIIHQGLIEVVNNPYGTAHRKLKPYLNYKIAGKTGTAQVVSVKKQKSNAHIKKIRDHSLFMGYAPYDNPEVVVVVISEHQPTALFIAGEFFAEALRPGR